MFYKNTCDFDFWVDKIEIMLGNEATVVTAQSVHKLKLPYML